MAIYLKLLSQRLGLGKGEKEVIINKSDNKIANMEL